MHNSNLLLFVSKHEVSHIVTSISLLWCLCGVFSCLVKGPFSYLCNGKFPVSRLIELERSLVASFCFFKMFFRFFLLFIILE